MCVSQKCTRWDPVGKETWRGLLLGIDGVALGNQLVPMICAIVGGGPLMAYWIQKPVTGLMSGKGLLLLKSIATVLVCQGGEELYCQQEDLMLHLPLSLMCTCG